MPKELNSVLDEAALDQNERRKIQWCLRSFPCTQKKALKMKWTTNMQHGNATSTEPWHAMLSFIVVEC
jgi:hypothetical protein